MTPWSTALRAACSKAAEHLPNWILRRLYPVQKQKDRIVAYWECRETYIRVNPESALRFDLLQFNLCNMLPFPIELLNSEVIVSRDGVQQMRFEKSFNREIGPISKSNFFIEPGLNENQAKILTKNCDESVALEMGLDLKVRTPSGVLQCGTGGTLRFLIDRG